MISFHSSTGNVVVSHSIKDLSERDKVGLCRALMDDLGILEALALSQPETKRALSIITECWTMAWEGTR